MNDGESPSERKAPSFASYRLHSGPWPFRMLASIQGFSKRDLCGAGIIRFQW